MKLIDPATGQAVWDSNDPNAGPVPPAPEGRQWVRVDEPGDTMAPRLRAPGILDIGNGVTERLAFLNQTFNPVEGIGSAMRAGSRMMAPDQSYWDRIASLGEMASGVASIAAPIAAAKAIGVPAASAMMEGLLGASPTSQAATDMARGFVTDESGAFRLYQGSPHDFAAERLVRMPDGSTQYIVGSPNVLPDVPPGAEVLRDFPLGRQRMDKIGTGEGAQAYGYGLYGAENEAIARSYRDALAGTALPSGDPVSNAWDMIHRVGGNDPQMRSMIRESFVDMMEDADPKTAEFARQSVEAIDSGAVDAFKAPGHMYELEVNANPEDFLDWDKPLSEQPQAVRDALANVDVRAGNMSAKDRAETISAALSGDPRLAHLLRDRTINATGDVVYKGMSDTLGAMDWPVGADTATRQQFYSQGAANASQALREAGIPGIRYFDAGSRTEQILINGKPPEGKIDDLAAQYLQNWGNRLGRIKIELAADKSVPKAQREEVLSRAKQLLDEGAKITREPYGSRNYVIFDENLINIVRKYGIAGAATMLGVSAFDVEQALAENMSPSQWDQLVVGPQ